MAFTLTYLLYPVIKPSLGTSRAAVRPGGAQLSSARGGPVVYHRRSPLPISCEPIELLPQHLAAASELSRPTRPALPFLVRLGSDEAESLADSFSLRYIRRPDQQRQEGAQPSECLLPPQR